MRWYGLLPPPICAVYDAYLRVPSGCQHRGDGLAQTLRAAAQRTSAPRAPRRAPCPCTHTRGHKPSAVLRRESQLAAVEKLLVLVLVEQVAGLRPRCPGVVEAQVAERMFVV